MSRMIAQKLSRACEAAWVTAHAADPRSAVALAASYRSILTSSTDPTPVAARVRINGRVFPLAFRKCDIFTLAEVIYERQYRLRVPLPDRPVIVDAGANFGAAAAWFLAHHPDADLHCFEPQSENFRLLSANLGGRPNVALHRAAVGAHAGTVALHLAAHGAEHSTVAGAAGAATEVVPAVRLADYLATAGLDRVDLLKLDVEGSEIDALVGLGDDLRRVGAIVGEVHERLIDQGQFYALLAEAGFRVLGRATPPRGGAEGVHQFEAVRAIPAMAGRAYVRI